jgi:protocatechuate 3,4-dioxygenase beta subunit
LIRLSAVLAFFITLTPAVAQVPKAVVRNAGSISGRLTIDGKSRPGLRLELIKVGLDGFHEATVMSVTTGKGGRYLFKGVPAGIYDVAPDTPSASVPSEGASGNLGKNVVLERDEDVTEINFDLVSKGGISGRVLDSNGQPVAGEAVEYLLKRDDGSLEPLSLPSPLERSTNAEGVYHIAGLPPGRYVVKVGIAYGLTVFGPDNKMRSRFLETFHPDVNESSQAVAVQVTSSHETSNADIRVGPPLTTYKIEGQILSDNGAVVPDIWLSVQAKRANGRDTSGVSGIHRSNANGEFTIVGALPGRYVVYPENDDEKNVYGDPVSVEVKESDATGLKINMHSASSISGIVSFEGSSDSVTSEKLSGLRVVAHYLVDEPMGRNNGGPIESGGIFHIPGVRPGMLELAVEDESGVTPPWLTLLRVEHNGRVGPNALEVAPGEEASGVKLVVGAGTGVLRGEVKIEGGELTGLHLLLSFRPTNASVDTPLDPADIDARGRFLIQNLVPGEYELTIGPYTAYVVGDGAGAKLTRSRMPTVKRMVTVVAGGESQVTLVLPLSPTPLP